MLSVSRNKITSVGIPFVSFITHKEKKKGGGNDEVDLRKLSIKPVVFLELLIRDLQQSICIKRPTLARIEFHVAINAGRHSPQLIFLQYSYKRARCFAKTLNKGRRSVFFSIFCNCVH